MRIVLDLNVLLISLPRNSRYRPIFDSLRSAVFELGVSNEILFEYVEVLTEKTSPAVAENVVKMLINLENVTNQEIYFNWNLIFQDEDDYKYVDCAVAFNADYLVSEDKHFNVLKSIDFPKLNVMDADSFLQLLSEINKS